jgi:uncharacterized delta-60 repeat protein
MHRVGCRHDELYGVGEFRPVPVPFGRVGPRRAAFATVLAALLLAGLQVPVAATPTPGTGTGTGTGFGDAGGGAATTVLGDGGDARARALVRASDGSLVVAGYARDEGRYEMTVSRYTSAGVLDPTFGNAGVALIPLGSGSAAQANAALVQPDGKIVVGGAASDEGQQKFAVVRLNPNGSLDTTFGSNGVVLTAVGGENSTFDSVVNALLLQPDGSVVAVGTTAITVQVGVSQSMQSVVALARYTSAGSLDNGFGKAGLVVTTVGNASYATGNAALLQADGKIVAAGSAFQNVGTDVALLRFNTDGSADTGFGTSGVVLSQVGSTGGTAVAYALAPGPSGDIVAAGYAQDHGHYKFMAARYAADGSADTTFGKNGSVLTDVGDAGSASANALVAESDGSLVGVGTALDGGRRKVAVARWTPAGTVDTGFGVGGISLTAHGDSASAAAGLALSDGSVLAAGSTLDHARFDMLLVRVAAGS